MQDQAPTTITLAPPAQGAPDQVYQAYVYQSRVLREQLDRLEGQRGDLQRELEQASSPIDKKGIEGRLAQVDQRIASLDQAIATSDQEVAKAAAVPGAHIERPPPQRQGPPEEAFVLGGIFIIVIGFPIAFAYARRIWKRSVTTVLSIPQDIYDRFNRIDQAMDSVAIEVERVGESQRFLTRLYSEQKLGAGPAQRVEAPERLKARE